MASLDRSYPPDSRAAVITPIVVSRLPESSRQAGTLPGPDPHGKQVGVTDPCLCSFYGDNVVIHLVLAGLDVYDQHLAPVLRGVNDGAYLLLVQHLPAPYNLVFDTNP